MLNQKWGKVKTSTRTWNRTRRNRTWKFEIPFAGLPTAWRNRKFLSTGDSSSEEKWAWASLQVISSKPCNVDYTLNDFHAANPIRIQDYSRIHFRFTRPAATHSMTSHIYSDLALHKIGTVVPRFWLRHDRRIVVAQISQQVLCALWARELAASEVNPIHRDACLE